MLQDAKRSQVVCSLYLYSVRSVWVYGREYMCLWVSVCLLVRFQLTEPLHFNWGTWYNYRNVFYLGLEILMSGLTYKAIYTACTVKDIIENKLNLSYTNYERWKNDFDRSEIWKISFWKNKRIKTTERKDTKSFKRSWNNDNFLTERTNFPKDFEINDRLLNERFFDKLWKNEHFFTEKTISLNEQKK